MKLEYVTDDIKFTDCECVAHCISADCAMGKGVVLEIEKMFPGNREYCQKNAKYGVVDVCFVIDYKYNSKVVYNMVTKKKAYYHVGSGISEIAYKVNLQMTLATVRDNMLTHGYKTLAMPRIGCGLDKFRWNLVVDLLHSVFDSTDINIKVYSLVKDLTMCVTGHRPADMPNEYGYDFNNTAWGSLIETMKTVIMDNHVRYAISGMALGVDIAFALAVLELKKMGYDIKLEAAIPCLNQEGAWTDNAKQLYKDILSECDKVTYVSDKPYNYKCMQARNEYMVSHSDIVLAVWSGKTSGGTYNTIRYAAGVNKRILRIRP